MQGGKEGTPRHEGSELVERGVHRGLLLPRGGPFLHDERLFAFHSAYLGLVCRVLSRSMQLSASSIPAPILSPWPRKLPHEPGGCTRVVVVHLPASLASIAMASPSSTRSKHPPSSSASSALPVMAATGDLALEQDVLAGRTQGIFSVFTDLGKVVDRITLVAIEFINRHGTPSLQYLQVLFNDRRDEIKRYFQTGG